VAPVSEKLRILVTGFGPFPGAPYNPTQPLVARLTRLRRPAFADVELSSHIFPVTYKAVDRELPLALAEHKPHALLMFGLAGRTGYVRVETRARNAVTMLWPDAAQTRARKGSISDGADAQRFGPHTAKLLRAAKSTGLDARASRDAGSYLCNYLSWRAIESVNADNGPRLATFVHIPPLARGGAVRRKGFSRITLEELVDAGEAMLMEMVRLSRRAGRERKSLVCRYMLDTNALNGILDLGRLPSTIHGNVVCITHAQRDEIENTTNSERRTALLNTLQLVGPETLATSGAVFDVSRWDQATWGEEGSALQSIYDQISCLDTQAGKRSSDANRWRDALIAETARENKLVLVTNDTGLTTVGRNHGLLVITIEEFLDNR